MKQVSICKQPTKESGFSEVKNQKELSSGATKSSLFLVLLQAHKNFITTFMIRKIA